MMPIAFNKSRRRPRLPVVERGESSVGRKRARSPPPRYYSSDDDDENNDGVVEAGGVPEEEGSDDDRPIRVVSLGGSTSTAPAASTPSCSDSSSVIRDVTVENPSAFDCTICYLPLKSPIIQCKVGHVVCSACHGKLATTSCCHVCRVPTPDGGYSRCIAMEQAVNTIRVPCPHAAHGCTERPVYHGRDAHAQTCAHKPCRCPGEGCGFAGPVQTTLLEHFAAVHGWPCSAGNATGLSSLHVRLRKGINVVVVTTTTEQQQYTLVLNVYEAAPVCNAINAFCIHRSNTGTVRLHLYYELYSDSDVRSWYLQSSHLQVVCTDLSNGMPNNCFPVLVPKKPDWFSMEGEEDEDIDIRLIVGHN